MTISKNGQWISDDPKYQYMSYYQEAGIVKIKKYSWGFNSVEVVYEKFGTEKFTETTLPRHHFKKIISSNLEEAMLSILYHYKGKNPTDPNIKQRLFEYKNYLNKNYPEKLI